MQGRELKQKLNELLANVPDDANYHTTFCDNVVRQLREAVRRPEQTVQEAAEQGYKDAGGI
jgi:hypothetical protein